MLDKIKGSQSGLLPEKRKPDIRDIIVQAFKAPGVRISRAEFLERELKFRHPRETVDKAIASNPARAGISADEIDRIADEVINFERNCVSGISFALGFPGGWSMAATIPADMAQYYGYTLRAIQKLLYLYGFPEIGFDSDGAQLDSATFNQIMLCLGVMNGVAGANNGIKVLAKGLSVGVERKLLNMALTKGALYPLVKEIMKWFGVNVTKKVFAGFFRKAIPVLGGFLSGGTTFVLFKKCCDNLKKELKDTYLSNLNHKESPEETLMSFRMKD